MKYSVNWIMWRAFIKHTTCLECATRNGRIFSYDDLIRIGEPQLHPNCGCRLERIEAIQAGMATALGANGADWYEADINYTGGYRNKQRLLFSNDGLIFVTFDHYETFAEIIGED